MTQSPNLPKHCQDTLADALRPDLFKALCDPVRISIVATLATRAEPTTVSDIAGCCGIDFSGVSRHLKVLREAGILAAEKQGREMRYVLKVDEFADTLRAIADGLVSCRAAAA